MSYRPYPSRERAQRQLDRHEHPALAPSEFQLKMQQDARAALEAAGRTMRPFHEAMLQMAASAPALLAQTAPAASRMIAGMRQRAAAS
ncbi:hypothetical protein ACFZBC_09020 [Streptomyces luteogriseus]|uniref:hypothetical protein n=1 Tax=Streptomyces luteogriseus TaxID=68233 RepID=UPI0036EC45C1